MAPSLPFTSLLRSSLASSSTTTISSSSPAVICSSKRLMSRAVPFPVTPYDPLRPLRKDHPPPNPQIHPLAKWDNFLDIPTNPSNPLATPIANDHPIIPQRFPAEGSSADDKMLAKRLIAAQTGLSEDDIRTMHRFTLGHKRVVNMTKGGRAAQHFIMCIVGSPEKGLLGIGQGKNVQMGKASDQAFNNALKNIDSVRRFQNRTVWGAGANMRIKYGAVVCQMRARPPGFGLMCSPTLHHIFTACGIKDVSAKMYGSMNVMQSLKALGHILQGGSKSPGLGDGVGSHGNTGDKGRGMRGVEEIELERGRYGVEHGSKLTRL